MFLNSTEFKDLISNPPSSPFGSPVTWVCMLTSVSRASWLLPLHLQSPSCLLGGVLDHIFPLIVLLLFFVPPIIFYTKIFSFSYLILPLACLLCDLWFLFPIANFSPIFLTSLSGLFKFQRVHQAAPLGSVHCYICCPVGSGAPQAYSVWAWQLTIFWGYWLSSWYVYWGGVRGQLQSSLMSLRTSILVFYCCIRNHHKCSHLKPHTFTISQFPWVKGLGTA